MNHYDVVVVGSGISGLSFAHHAVKNKLKVLVLEKSSMPGGSFHTANLNAENTSFWLELGAHTCYNSYGNFISIIEDCGIIQEISPRAKVPFRLIKEGKIKSFMAEINFLELIGSLPRALGKKKTGETVASYYGSILGRKNFKKVFSALFSAVPSQNADDFPADALFKKRDRRKDVLKHYTMKNGLGSITSAIAGQSGLEVRYDVGIEKIEQDAEGYLVDTISGQFHSKNLCISTPVPAVPALISSFAPDVAGKVSKIAFQEIESFGVVVEKESIDVKPFAGLVPVRDDFFSVVSRDTVPDARYRGFTFHFKPGLLDNRQKIDKVCSVLSIKPERIVKTNEKVNIVPSLRLGHYDLIKEIDDLLAGQNLFLSGNYFAGLSIEDCVSRSKAEADRMMVQRVL